eukprot:TRINITY_DN37798_c0_g1_i1.p1 TRINITY_DN37798_c0_g1~~TRINITY_DN37798_c0_g1_i1.p1  ORF type:complete len:494 (+),score=23.69 TRINITY_DN37798_c0_g1_i1:2-1483(+)
MYGLGIPGMECSVVFVVLFVFQAISQQQQRVAYGTSLITAQGKFTPLSMLEPPPNGSSYRLARAMNTRSEGFYFFTSEGTVFRRHPAEERLSPDWRLIQPDQSPTDVFTTSRPDIPIQVDIRGDNTTIGEKGVWLFYDKTGGLFEWKHCGVQGIPLAAIPYKHPRIRRAAVAIYVPDKNHIEFNSINWDDDCAWHGPHAILKLDTSNGLNTTFPTLMCNAGKDYMYFSGLGLPLHEFTVTTEDWRPKKLKGDFPAIGLSCTSQPFALTCGGGDPENKICQNVNLVQLKPFGKQKDNVAKQKKTGKTMYLAFKGARVPYVNSRSILSAIYGHKMVIPGIAFPTLSPNKTIDFIFGYWPETQITNTIKGHNFGLRTLNQTAAAPCSSCWKNAVQQLPWPVWAYDTHWPAPTVFLKQSKEGLSVCQCTVPVEDMIGDAWNITIGDIPSKFNVGTLIVLCLLGLCVVCVAVVWLVLVKFSKKTVPEEQQGYQEMGEL